jgi:hypothetical protein
MNSYPFGPSGGDGGNTVDQPIPDDAQIIGFEVKWDEERWIRYFGLWWKSPSGPGVVSVGDIKNGDKDLQRTFGPAEYIIGFSGTYNKYVNSLILYTNQQAYSAGSGNGVPFEYRLPPLDGATRLQVVGLFARGDKSVDAFGIRLAVATL